MTKQLLTAACLLSACIVRPHVYVPHPRVHAPHVHIAVPVDAEVVVGEPPVAQVETIGAAPSANHVWIKGHWGWHGRWVWEPGYWETVRHGHAWEEGQWVRHRHGWAWVPGHWRPL